MFEQSKPFPAASFVIFIVFLTDEIPFEREMILACVLVIVFEAILLLLCLGSKDNLYKEKPILVVRRFLGSSSIIPVLFTMKWFPIDISTFFFAMYYSLQAFIILFLIPYILSKYGVNYNFKGK